MNILILFTLSAFIVCVNCALPRVDPLVLISQGLVRGQKASDGDYSAFFGIPYAQVDTDNPFGAAQTPSKFEEEIFNAYDNSVQCPQVASSLARDPLNPKDDSLDCLRLNIFVPYQASSLNPLPVLVWIHGGAFMFGGAKEFSARNLVRHGIIVVTLNYRLGPYGFMCLNDPAVPGNQGLKDQYAALGWIRDNIAAFGGNPHNLTLAGQSAGAISALLHLYSSKEKLFHKIIVESGTPLMPGSFVDGDPEAALKLTNYLGFNASDTEQALSFLTQTHHSLVTGAVHDLKLHFQPCKEKSFSGVANFVSSDPYSLSNEKKVKNTPILIGHTQEEYYRLISENHDDNYYKSDIFHETLKNNFKLDEEQLKKASDIVRHFYIGDQDISRNINTEAIQFNSDFLFNHPIQDTITNLLSERANPIYEYLFSYVGDSTVPVADHSAELQFLFGDDGTVEHTPEHLLMTNRITTLWSNFVKYGNPTPESTDLIPVSWTPVTKDARPYFIIDSDLRMEHRVFKERMAFWDLFYSLYGKYSKLVRECNYT